MSLFLFGASVCLAQKNMKYELEPQVTYKKNYKSKEKSKEQIYLKNEVLWCTGKNKLASVNNSAAELIKTGQYEKGIEVLTKDLANAPLFFPFRYNLGVAHMYLENFPKALLHLEKARYIVPQYSKTYVQIGYIYFLKQKYSIAIDYYRKALRRNKKDLNILVLIGNIYLSRNQMEIAKKYYDESLRINHRYANGLLGRAKIHFHKKEYIKALTLLRSVKTDQEYD